MIKKVQKKVMRFTDITQFYCDSCTNVVESENSYCPKGWMRLVREGETILNMTDVLVCGNCYESKLLPWLYSQKKNIKPTV